LAAVAVGKFGERGWNRTTNLLIKSQLLCQLSYAPFALKSIKEGQSQEAASVPQANFRQRSSTLALSTAELSEESIGKVSRDQTP
jgi:hypothetical protein